MTTAAEKFDLVPPWCRLGNTCIEAMPLQHPGVWAKADGTWGDSSVPDIDSKDVRRIARLTRPLDSWEPAPDCPLPVEGWSVREHPPWTGWYLYDGNEMDVGTGDNSQFPTRRDAIVWAWTEAPAPAEAKPRPITEADVKVGQRWKSKRGYVRRITKDGYYNETIDIHGPQSLTKTVADINREGWTLITDDTGAKEGPDCEAINALDDRIGAVETKVEDMADVLARICPEADSQTDGKGLTLVEIDEQLTQICASLSLAHERLDNLSAKVDRLVAAQVSKPATLNTRSDDASTNEVMTEAAASDEGWREMLVPWTWPCGRRHWATPDGRYHYTDNSKISGWIYMTKQGNIRPSQSGDPEPSEIHLKDRRTCPPPPNLAEWWKPKAALLDGTLAAPLAVVTAERDAAREAVPSTYRVGDDLAAWVRHLASAHDTALKYQRELERKLADANTAAVAAEGRAATAVKRASKAEEELADLCGKVENLRAAFSG